MTTPPAASAGPPAEPVFREPWEAQVFALVVSLSERGVFSWPQWTAALVAATRRADAAGEAGTRTGYHHWLDALEALLAARGVAPHEELARYREAWAQAAARTRHGQPITLEAGDFPPAGPVPSGSGA